jgi:hypothetical protein
MGYVPKSRRSLGDYSFGIANRLFSSYSNPPSSTGVAGRTVNPPKLVDVLRFGAYDVEHKRHNSSVQIPGSGVKYYIDAPKALIAFSVKSE